MSDNEPPPLPADVRALLRAEQQRPDVAPELRLRLRARLAASGAGGTGGGPSHGAGNAGHRVSGTSPSSAGALRGLARGVRMFARVLPVFVAGGVTGAALHAEFSRPAPRVVTTVHEVRVPVPVVPAVASPPPAPSVPAPLEPPSTPPSPDGPAVATSTRAPLPAPAAASSADPASTAIPATHLHAEDALLSVARTALARGRYAAALTALEQHARRFPRGQLSEEREALAVQALVGVGRVDEARARVGRFRRSYPQSLFGPTLDAALSQSSATPSPPDTQ